MSVLVDASSPDIVNGTGVGGLTCSSFTPPAGSLLVAVACGGWNSSNTLTAALSDSLSGAWTSRVTANGTFNPGGLVQISTRVIGSSAASMTVTVTYDANLGGGRMLGVYVVTGADNTNMGASAIYHMPPSTTSLTKSLTTTVTGSLVLGGADVDSAPSGETLSLASNTAWAPMAGSNPVTNNTDGVAYAITKGSSTTGTPGATTFGVTLSQSSHGQLALLEVKPAPISNISAADSSSPAANNAVVQANIAGADTGTGTEAAGIAVDIVATDTGSAVDTVSKVTIPAADAAIGDEAMKVLTGGATLAFASDVIAAAEASPIVIRGAVDTFTAAEVSQAGINGPLPPGPRIVRIEAD